MAAAGTAVQATTVDGHVMDPCFPCEDRVLGVPLPLAAGCSSWKVMRNGERWKAIEQTLYNGHVAASAANHME